MLERGLEEKVATLSLQAALGALLLLLGLILLSTIVSRRNLAFKTWAFAGICLVVLSTTTLLIGSTIYLNQVSSSKGPVHWHADLEVWDCGQELNLKDPVGRFSNKIGTPTLHEHNDKRIHLEGVVVEPADASLSKFFKVIGGFISQREVEVPTNQGLKELKEGDNCGSETAVLQMYVYRTNPDKTYTKHFVDLEDYTLSPLSNVPPGDCLVIELAPVSQVGQRLCRSYQVALETGRLKGKSSDTSNEGFYGN